ncbi:serine hydrolase-like [Plasmopara halstedii]|uniref:Serine hydrolase-like n=1 Tax=Plasmopara halstedii TaxID=4781 RepID=A0A0P1AIB0_PLAHL|nr:serine hydrolase-like [Plasmopara halstedii]CEG40239.1 serine hydrolase-like [Plasmopara halstedii]|eukprot:XP_024576608.1 serine hydrolase-like [Plasmopara halstedii]
MTRPIRVLCLHGWRTSGQILQRQTSALRHAFGIKAELLYLDAPWAASGPAPELVRSFYGKTGPFFQWWDALKRKDGVTYRYEGLEHSLDYLTGQVQSLGTVDAVLGFSQGAAIATLLTAHYQTTYNHVPWKVCILVAGFYPRTVETQELLDAAKRSADGAIDIPSVHVIGKADPLITQMEKLFRSFSSINRVKFEHDEGHKFPSSLKYKQMYHDIAQEVLAKTSQAWR